MSTQDDRQLLNAMAAIATLTRRLEAAEADATHGGVAMEIDEAEFRRLVADAARYRWLRDVGWEAGMARTMALCYYPKQWDKYIDEAIAQSTEGAAR